MAHLAAGLVRGAGGERVYADAKDDGENGGGGGEAEEADVVDEEMGHADQWAPFPGREHLYAVAPKTEDDVKVVAARKRVLREDVKTPAEAERAIAEAKRMFQDDPTFGTANRQGKHCWMCDYAPSVGAAERQGKLRQNCIEAMSKADERNLDSIVQGIFDWHVRIILPFSKKPWTVAMIRDHILLHVPIRKQVLLEDYRIACAYASGFERTAFNKAGGPPDVKASKEMREWMKQKHAILREMAGIDANRA